MSRVLERSPLLVLFTFGCISVTPNEAEEGEDEEQFDDPGIVSAPDTGRDWLAVATIGGLSVAADMSDEELGARLNDLVRQNVTVVEADSRLSDYLSEADFADELGVIRRVGALAHERNLRLVWYYPSLEVLTPDGETAESSMAKDHSDWVQLSADGSQNVFYGSKVFWVEPGAESAWMSPHSPYREYYLDRVERIAETGIDGLWLDVPLFNDIVGKWPSHNPHDVAAFKAATGFDVPVMNDEGSFDPRDPVVRRWIAWRHTAIDAFLKAVHQRVIDASPTFNLIVETVTMDYNAALLEGLDGAFQGDLPRFAHVWEVDVLSDDSSMQFGREDDFVSLIAMYAFGRGADRGHAAWAFTYGVAPDDAEAVMAIALANGVNPYELKSPEMTTTVSPEYRTQQFGWVRANADALFRTPSAAKVLLLHSSASRDVVDGLCVMPGDCGVSLFASWERPDPEMAWWTDGEKDGLYAADYMAEYRGLVKALVHAHTPFDLLPSRLMTAARLAEYDVVVAPAFWAASDEEVDLLRGFAESGGHVLFTGGTPATVDEVGGERGVSALAEVLPSVDGTVGCASRVVGAGSVHACQEFVGRTSLRTGAATADEALASVVSLASPTAATAGTSEGVYLTLRADGPERVIHLVNLKGADGSFSVEPQTVPLRVYVGDGAIVESVIGSSPRSPEPTPLEFSRDGGWAVVEVPVEIQRLVTVRLRE